MTRAVEREWFTFPPPTGIDLSNVTQIPFLGNIVGLDVFYWNVGLSWGGDNYRVRIYFDSTISYGNPSAPGYNPVCAKILPGIAFNQRWGGLILSGGGCGGSIDYNPGPGNLF